METENSLFRPEVLHAKGTQYFGSIRIAKSLSHNFVVGIAVLFGTILICFAVFGEVARKATVHGVMLPSGGVINVSAAQAGVVFQLLVREGDRIERGQSLALIRNERITSAGDVAVLERLAIDSQRQSLLSEKKFAEQGLRQRQDAISQRMQNMQVEIRQAETELESHKFRVQLSLKNLERQRELEKDGFVSAVQAQTKEEELLDTKLREKAAERNLQALRRDLIAAQNEKIAAETQIQTSLAQIARTAASLEQEAAQTQTRNGLTITAVQDGIVGALPVNVGQSVQAGQTILSIVPVGSTKDAAERDVELQAELFAPSRTAGFIEIGQEALVRFAAYPYQKFGMHKGTVVAISRTPLASQDLPAGQAQALSLASQANEPMYRITVRLEHQSVAAYGKTIPLTPGMSIDADIRQETRRIWEWLLEPILALRASGGIPQE